jgi:hypothetical protein
LRNPDTSPVLSWCWSLKQSWPAIEDSTSCFESSQCQIWLLKEKRNKKEGQAGWEKWWQHGQTTPTGKRGVVQGCSVVDVWPFVLWTIASLG